MQLKKNEIKWLGDIMVERIKMPRSDRAKQFSPFDALKGLQEVIKIKEYEHDRIVRGEMSEDEIKEISAVLAKINKGDSVQLEFFRDGHVVKLSGNAKIDVLNQKLYVGAFEIDFDEIRKIKILEQ